MDRMDGVDLLSRMQVQFKGRLPRIIFCTTENRPSALMEILEAGAAEYIMKPFDEQVLRFKLAQVGIPVATTEGSEA
jgi:two-component system, chemotaxis family, chemotaxis protein CheY